MECFPLVDIGIQIIKEISPDSADIIPRVLPVFEGFITGKASYSSSIASFKAIFPSILPLERIKLILECINDPIPPCPPSVYAIPQNMRRKTRPWTSAEDNRLLFAIYKFGVDNWPAVSNFVGFGRNRTQCSQRWMRGIDPRVSKSRWTHEEEGKLALLVQQYGEKSWTKIASEFGNRSDVQCRYHFSQMSHSQNPIPAKAADAPLEMKAQPGLNLGNIAEKTSPLENNGMSSIDPSMFSDNGGYCDELCESLQITEGPRLFNPAEFYDSAFWEIHSP